MSSLLADELLASGFLEAGTISLPEIVYGADGTGIYSCNWDNSGHLTITLTDGRVFVSPSLTGLPGSPGTPGAPGVGVPVGGLPGMVLQKRSGADYDTEWIDQSGGNIELDTTLSQSGKAADAAAVGTALASKGTYSKPSGGIPKTDLASAVQASLGKADTAYQKPSGGIPASDLDAGVIPSLSDYATKQWVINQSYLTPFTATAILMLSEDGQGGYTGVDAETGRTVDRLNVFNSLYMQEGKRVLLQIPVGGSTTIKRYHPLGTFNQADGAYFPVLSGSSMTGMYVLERTGWRYVQIPATTADAALSPTSENPVQNKVIKAALDLKADSAELAAVATSGSYSDLSNTPTIPTVPQNVSAFTNDAGYLTAHQDVSGKQDKNLGTANAGKFLVVGSDGNITAVTMTAWSGGSY